MALSNKATMYRDMGRNEQSTRVFKESFAVAKGLPKDDPALAAILIGMAAERSSKGDLKKAEQFLQRALRIREAHVGPNHLDTSEVLNNLGVVQLQRKRYAEAESSLKRALVIMETHGGADHPDVAVVLNNLGNLYYQRKDFETAESVLTRALNIRRKTLAESFSTADSLLALGQLYMSTNCYAQAQTLLQEAVAIRNHGRGDANPGGLLTLETYALTLRANGYTGEADAIQARAKLMRAQLRFVLRY
jgi:tetratricopeptide (TPR) repeat protein